MNDILYFLFYFFIENTIKNTIEKKEYIKIYKKNTKIKNLK